MQGRYGTDNLNKLITTVGIVTSLLSLFIRHQTTSLVLMIIAYTLLILALFRALSKKTGKRYRENRKYLALLQRIGDRDHRYFRCPKCRQQVRVPKKKGKVAVTCPKCKEKFIKKT